MLGWAEVVLDVEVALNIRPLSYLEDDVELSVLTPNSMLQINLSYLPELEVHHVPDKDLHKQANILSSVKKSCGIVGLVSIRGACENNTVKLEESQPAILISVTL